MLKLISPVVVLIDNPVVGVTEKVPLDVFGVIDPIPVQKTNVSTPPISYLNCEEFGVGEEISMLNVSVLEQGAGVV